MGQINLKISCNKKDIRITGKYRNNQDAKLITQHTMLNNLCRKVEKMHLPSYYAYETARRLVKRDKWLFSYKHQMIELIWVLRLSNDVRLEKHISNLCKEINYVLPY